jgi:hypothetical protein
MAQTLFTLAGVAITLALLHSCCQIQEVMS